jgi:hypothetical protein
VRTYQLQGPDEGAAVITQLIALADNQSAVVALSSKGGLYVGALDLDTWQIRAWQAVAVDGIVASPTRVIYADNSGIILAAGGSVFACRPSASSPNDHFSCKSIYNNATILDSSCVEGHATSLRCFLAGPEGVLELSGSVAVPASKLLSSASAHVIAVGSTEAGSVAVAHGNATALSLHYESTAGASPSTAVAADLDGQWRTRVFFVSIYNLEEARYNTSVGAMIDGNMTQLHFDTRGVLWIGSDNCVNLLLPDLSFRRLDGVRGGLPYANVTGAVSTQPNTGEDAPLTTWLATTRGLLRYDYKTRRFRCLCSGRFLRPSTNVTSLVGFAAHGTAGVLAANTGGGLAFFVEQQYSLEAKAAELQKLVYPQVRRADKGNCFDVLVCAMLTLAVLY